MRQMCRLLASSATVRGERSLAWAPIAEPDLDLDHLPYASIIGGAAAICSMASFTPQLVKIWKERDASSISLRMYIVTVTGFALWIAYGVMSNSWPIIMANTVCMALSAAILVLKWRFSKKSPRA